MDQPLASSAPPPPDLQEPGIIAKRLSPPQQRIRAALSLRWRSSTLSTAPG
jgi:hypothetical protein